MKARTLGTVTGIIYAIIHPFWKNEKEKIHTALE